MALFPLTRISYGGFNFICIKVLRGNKKTIKLRIVRELIYLSVGKTQMRVKKKKKTGTPEYHTG